MSVEKIITEWKKNKYKPVYWLEGEEEYYIDKLVKFAENEILTQEESSFNLTVFYGRDANWADIINACRRYPMFSEKQVVIIKEAQNLKEIDRLEAYVAQPLTSTILVIAYKDKKLDARTRFSKMLKEKAEYITTKKMSENTLPEWINKMVSEFGFNITPKANALLVDHIGNEPERLENEIEKVTVNLKDRKSITEDDIENFVGISKDYNIYELQSAIATKNFPKAIKIIRYFGENDKAAPIQLIIPSLYAFFSKVFMIFGANVNDANLPAKIGVPPYYLRNYIEASRVYGYSGVEKNLLLFHQYNLKSIGIGTARVEDESLMKEMLVKMMN